MIDYTMIEVEIGGPALENIDVGIPIQRFETEALVALYPIEGCIQVFSPFTNYIMWLPKGWCCP